MSENKKKTATEGVTATARVRLVRVQWSPLGASRAKFRELGAYTWARGQILELPADEWEQLKPKRLVTKEEEFKELTLAQVKEIEEAQAAAAEQPPAPEEPAEETGPGVASNPTPAAGE